MKRRAQLLLMAGVLMCSPKLTASASEQTPIYEEIAVEEVSAETAAGEVKIDAVNFPDEIFRTYVLDKIDSDDNGVLSETEIKKTTRIEVHNKGISSLEGLQYFTEINTLYCQGNQLSSLDISKNTALTDLYCEENQLTELDMSSNPVLKTVVCYDNQISSLDVSQNTALKHLTCGGNQLKSLDVSKNPALEDLACYNNQLSELDVSQNPALADLMCANNQISSLDVSHNPELTDLMCDENQLKSLDVSQNPKLELLHCAWNQIGSLDVSKNPALTSLACLENQISELDVSQNPALKSLLCGRNPIGKLDVSNNPALDTLQCFENQLSELDVSNNPLLKSFVCDNNQLRKLDVSNNPALDYFLCFGNPLASMDVSQNTVLSEFTGGSQIKIASEQIDMLAYDEKFDSSKVSGLENLSLDGNTFSFIGGKRAGSYIYDCGQNWTMKVWLAMGKPDEPGQPDDKSEFEDVPYNPGNWKYEGVKYVYEHGIMGGVGGSNEFKPDNQLTRAMFATVLYRIAGEPAVTYENRFTDVEEDKWYSNAIIWANNEGIVKGFEDGNYGIDNNITREQIAKMLCLFGQSQGCDVSARASLDSFTDAETVNSWAVEYVQWAVDAKMIGGKPNVEGGFRIDPKGEATRAECAKMLMMFMEKYK